METFFLVGLILGLAIGNFVGKDIGRAEGYESGIRGERLRMALLKCMVSHLPLEISEHTRIDRMIHHMEGKGLVVVEVPSPGRGGRRPPLRERWTVTIVDPSTGEDTQCYPAHARIRSAGLEIPEFQPLPTSQELDEFLFPDLRSSEFVFNYDDQAWGTRAFYRGPIF